MLIHKGTRTLTTDRLILRRYTPEDARQMFDNWACDREVTKYLRWEAHRDIEQTRGVLETWARSYEADSTYLWGIENKDTHVLMGSIGATVTDIDLCADVGYCLGQVFWGRGYMTEALTAVIRYLFFEVGVNRVEAFHSVNNPASGRVMQKAGMRYEGRARQGYLSVSGFQDSDMYGIIRSDLEGGEL